jgi:DNA-binding HxlR family transcriptional regulator
MRSRRAAGGTHEISGDALQMARTHRKVRSTPKSKRPHYTPASAAAGVEQTLKILDGRWKLEILFHLFDARLHRFSELARAIPAISEKMLAQQLRQMERDCVVRRVVHPEVPPRVEYALTPWGLTLCPALDALLEWLEQRPAIPSSSNTASDGQTVDAGLSRW